MAIESLRSVGAVAAAAEGDPLLVWAAQGMRPGVRAWSLDGATAVTSPDLSRRDRLVVRGPAGAAATLVRLALAEVGPAYRLSADLDLAVALAAAVPELEPVHPFGWMEAHRPTALEHGPAEWLDDADAPAIDALLTAAFPTSHARPGGSGVRRWAGVRVGTTVAASAAEAWSTPATDGVAGLGLMAGVAVHPDRRGTGIGRAACAFVLDALVAEHGRAALMVDSGNAPAICLYRRLGMTWRELLAARFRR
jgi:ribosomal protein S18 acetylase RimI-like enzyme